jgi:hypothetical protein
MVVVINNSWEPLKLSDGTTIKRGRRLDLHAKEQGKNMATSPDKFMLPYETPPSLSGAVFDAPEELESDGDILAIKHALDVGKAAAERALIAARAAHRNEMKTIPARHREARDAAQKITKPACQEIDRTRARVNSAIQQLQKLTHAPSPPRDAVAQVAAASIVSALLPMTPKDRTDTIMASLAAGDDRVMQAVLALPAFASGLTPTEADHLREQWRRSRLPAECRRLDELQKALGHLDRGGQLLLAFTHKLSSTFIVQEGERSEREAAEAMAPTLQP